MTSSTFLRNRRILTKLFRYLNNYVDNIFAGAWDPVEVKPLAVIIPMPTNQQGTTQSHYPKDCVT